MKHVRPLSKAILGPTTGILQLLQLLVTLGIVDLQELLNKDEKDTA